MDLGDLNPEQKRAVTHGEGPMLVVAGAGTGKTAVITRRIAWLIEQKMAKPEEILALTFTDKAANEMLDRLDGLLGWDAYRVEAMTFNAFGSQLLRRFGHHMGWPTSTELISDVAKLTLLKQHLSEIKLSYYGSQHDIMDFLEGCLNYIKALQNADISLADFKQFVAGMSDNIHELDRAEAKDRLAIYELYERLKSKAGVIDYNDQIMLPLQLLRQRPNLSVRLRLQYKYVLVDEYQDTNAAQDALLRSFVLPNGNIFSVGDDDQAIYGFRGAKLSNILNFADHYKVKQAVVLTENYRSGQTILDAAYRLIQHNNPDRLEAKLGLNKHLHGQTAGTDPIFSGYATPREEAESVMTGVSERLKAGVDVRNIAVLATSHLALKNVAKVFRDNGLAYQLSSSINIFEQPEILQLWYLLRWINFDSNDEAVAQLLMGPFVGWTSSEVRGLTEIAADQLLSVETALEKIADIDDNAGRMISRLKLWRVWAKSLNVSQLTYNLVFESGISQGWIERAQTSPRMVKVFEDLQLWMRHMQQYESVALDLTLQGYLSNFPKPPEIETEEISGGENGVMLLTIHASKGLEFDTVFLINCTEEAWSNRSGGRQPELPPDLIKQDVNLAPEHERRRMMYVAVTRTKTELIISAPVFTAGGRNRKVTPLLAEMLDSVEIAPAPDQVESNKAKKLLRELHRFAPKNVKISDRLPFETAEGWLELYTTDLEKYDRCPYEFYLERVLKIRTPSGSQINFGSLLHELFKEYYGSRQLGEALTLEQLQQRLDERWTKRGFLTEDDAQAAKDSATKTLDNFFQREESVERKFRSSEEAFTLVFKEYKLRVRGRIDASFEVAGGIEVRDFKTGRKRDADSLGREAKASMQLRTYALAIAEVVGKPPVRVVLDYVVTGVEGVAELSPTILKNHRVKLGEIAEKIRAREFEPNANAFHSCVAFRYWGNGEDDDLEGAAGA